ncbi:helix-turn-helix domain-containing protein [uncultured Parabacteroides sp.]|jgi:excisionase family DNA binding protein|uniref:helix-turn-helix domain-containing protein n=1 Tax=uncultured Parabacteroides sp. TaxID=512312 RepID=UPI0028056497|nr:helix-turn-helix domain-containing protein [uncultured Parabacteroides sp.]MBD9167104.1 DNA-binding protein [Parabacteroides johnsonii]
MDKVLIDSQIATLMPFFNPIIDAIAEKVTKRIKDIQVERIPKYYTRQETANILHVTLPTLHNMVKRGDIIAKRVNGRVLFDAAEIDSAVKDCRIYKYKRKQEG